MASTIQLNCTGGDFLSYTAPTSSNYSTTTSKTSAGLLGSNNENEKKAAAVFRPGYVWADYGGALLEFEHNSIIENKKITNVSLVYYLQQRHNNNAEPLKNSDDAGKFVEIISSYKSGYELDQITLDNFREKGALSELLVNEIGDKFNSNLTELTRSVNVTELFKSQFVNEKARFIISTGVNYTGSLPMADLYYFGIQSADYMYYESGVPSSLNTYDRYIPLTSCHLLVTYELMPQPDPVPVYPCGISIKEADTVTFTWQFNSETSLEQSRATIQYKKSTAENWTSITSNGNATSYTLSEHLEQGTYQWRVMVRNSEGEDSDYCETQTFNIFGKPSSPVINTPANKALTEINWQASGQEAVEIMLYDANNNLIEHVTEATTSASYKPQMFLFGNYNVKIRIKNNADIWSDFSQLGFSISGSTPSAGTLLIMPFNDYVRLECTVDPNTNSIIVRKEKGVETILTGSKNKTSYEDRTVKSGMVYEYVLRTWTNGYTDTPSKQAICDYEGAIISKDEKELNLKISDEKFIPHSGVKERAHALSDFVGRDYPLLELGSANRNSITKRFFVTTDEFETFLEITKDLKVYYRDGHNNAFAAAITRLEYTNFNNMGYILQFELTRLAEEEVKINV